jgi:hypothetical protein
MFKSPPSTADQASAFRQSLEAVPARNAAVKLVRAKNPDELQVEIELKYEGSALRVLRRLLRPADKKIYVLDKIGKRVYESIDGKKNFGELIDEFAAAEKLTFFESRALMGQYMQLLAKRGLVAATFPKRV